MIDPGAGPLLVHRASVFGYDFVGTRRTDMSWSFAFNLIVSFRHHSWLHRHFFCGLASKGGHMKIGKGASFLAPTNVNRPNNHLGRTCSLLPELVFCYLWNRRKCSSTLWKTRWWLQSVCCWIRGIPSQTLVLDGSLSTYLLLWANLLLLHIFISTIRNFVYFSKGPLLILEFCQTLSASMFLHRCDLLVAKISMVSAFLRPLWCADTI